MIDTDKVIDGALGIGKNIETGKDRQRTLTERQKIDMTSRYILPQIIRPIIALTALLMQIAILVAMFMEIDMPEHVVWEVGALNAATIGFYFNSRRNEKINAKKTEAAVKIEEIRTKHELREERRKHKAEIRAARKAVRKADG